jgi:hypothetical protein
VPQPTQPNLAIWRSLTSDGGNADCWLVLLDTGIIEIHAGTPYSDGGVLSSSKLFDTKALKFSSVQHK